MSAPAFTPGPWRVREPGFATILGMKRHTHFDGSFTDFEAEVARVQPSPVRAANARLIAAAPKMYGALEKCAALLDGVHGDIARAVLAEARGEQSEGTGP